MKFRNQLHAIEDLQVSRWEIVPVQFFSPNPCQLLATESPRFARDPVTHKKAKENSSLRINVGHLAQITFHSHFDSHLLHELTTKTVLPCLTHFPLPSRKLPITGEVGACRPLGDKQSSFPENQPGGDFN